MKRRIVVAASTVALLAAAIALPPQATLASWTDAEYGTAALGSLTVPAPVLGATCTLVPGILGLSPVITITWAMPAGYSLTDVSYATTGVTGLQVVTGGLLGSITTTANTPPNYTTKFGSGLLGGLLGGTKIVGIRLTHPGTTWMSVWATATASMGLAGSSPGCTVNPPSA